MLSDPRWKKDNLSDREKLGVEENHSNPHALESDVSPVFDQGGISILDGSEKRSYRAWVTNGS